MPYEAYPGMQPTAPKKTDTPRLMPDVSLPTKMRYRSAWRTRRFRYGAAVVVGLFLIPIVLISGIFTWSPLNNWNDLVDLKSGRIRRTRYILYMKVQDEVRETALSQVLRNNSDASVEPDWHFVNTFSPGSGHSPHYVFHSALGQINELESMWRVHPFSERAQQQVARRVLDLWQAELDDFHAGDYIAELWNLAAHYHDNRGRELITVSELEAPPPSGG